jgi:hypothetical protein
MFAHSVKRLLVRRIPIYFNKTKIKYLLIKYSFIQTYECTIKSDALDKHLSIVRVVIWIQNLNQRSALSI